MATIFCLPSDTTAAVSPTPSGTDWGHINSVTRQLLHDGFTAASGLATTAYNPDAGDHLTDINSMVAQFVSVELPPQTIAAGNVLIGARCSEVAASNNLFLAWKVYAVNVAGSSVLGTLVAVRRDGTEVIATTLTGRTDIVTSTLFSSTTPFRLCLEVGLGGLPVNTATDTHNGSIEFGTTSTGFVENTSTTSGQAFLYFADVNLRFSEPMLAVSKMGGLLQ